MKSSLFLLIFLLAFPAQASLFLYFTDDTGALRRTELDGANPTTLNPSLGSVLFLHADPQFLYFSDAGAHTLNRIDLDGSGLTVLAKANGVSKPRSLVPMGVGPDLAGIIYVNGSSKEVQQYDLATKTIKPIVQDLVDPWGMVRSGDTLYIVDRGAEQIVRHDLLDEDTEIYAELNGFEGLHGIDLVPGPEGPTLYVTSTHEVLAIDPDGQPTVLFDSAEALFTGVAASPTALFFHASATDELYQFTLDSGLAEVLHDPTSLPGLNGLTGLAATPVPSASVDDQIVTEDALVATFTVTLDQPTTPVVQIPYTTNDDSALAPSDYNTTSGTLVFESGATVATVEVPIVHDGAFEPNESFTLTLSPPTVGALLDPTGTATILTDSSIVTGREFTWGQNLGWTNWKTPTEDVHTLTSFLTGSIWNQNVGWITIGNGTPANGSRWANHSATDFGINLLPGGALSGFAWGQNIGWIAFEQLHGKPTLDYATGRFSGFAWSQTCGWINLGSGTNSALQTKLLEITDRDGDRIDDHWELQRVSEAGRSTDTLSGDLALLGRTTNFDTDPLTDIEEFQHHTDPFDPGSFTRIVAIEFEKGPPPREVNITWTSSPDRLYDLQRTEDLLLPFDDLLTGLSGDPDTFTTAAYLAESAPLRSFWRVGVRRPLAP